MRLLDQQIPTTLLVGAGLSAPAPVALPGWWALNDAVVGALSEALENATKRSGLSAALSTAVKRRRDTTSFLMPDLQAQLIEDQIGEAYFRALAVVDSDQASGAHQLIAKLCSERRLGAIITTNFDTTIERALECAGVSYQCFESAADFEELSAPATKLRLVKVHGSATRPETMVDTLRQRLAGRPDAVMKWIVEAFKAGPTLALGFSCDDLNYDPRYLGIRQALEEGASFHFLVREQSKPSPSQQALVAEFPKSVQIVHGELPDWVFQLAEEAGVTHDVPAPRKLLESEIERCREAVRQRLRGALGRWASSLSAMEVFNATASLFASAGERTAADELLRRVWTSYRRPEDCNGSAYARYLFNYGETLLRAAELRNPHNREQDLVSWKAAADRDPHQFFARALQFGTSLAAEARELLTDFLAGSPIPTLAERVGALQQRLIEQGETLHLEAIDAALSFAELMEHCGLGRAATPWLERAYQSARLAGDDLRRADVAWRLGRNLAYGLEESPEHQSRVEQLCQESVDIAARLDIRRVDAGSALALAIAAIVVRDWEVADMQATRARGLYAQVPDALGEFHADRERMRALMGKALGTGSLSVQPFDELLLRLQSFVSERVPGLAPIVQLELGRLAIFVEEKLATELAQDALALGTMQAHRVVPSGAEALLRQIKDHYGT